MNYRNIRTLFLSYLFIGFVGVSSAFFYLVSCVIWLASRPFDPRKTALNLFASFWASVYLWCMPLWSVKIKGRQKMDMQNSYVVVSNHQSQLDILLIYRLFFPMRWVSKAAVFKLPFIGWNMLLLGYIKLKRGDKESIKQMMDQCERLLEQNISIMMFPEGTRSKTGIVKPFKPGAFILAKKKKKPILPMVINNSKNALPKHSIKIEGRYQMSVTVLNPVPYEVFKDMPVDDISQMVRHQIQSHVKEHIELEQEKYIGKQFN